MTNFLKVFFVVFSLLMGGSVFGAEGSDSRGYFTESPETTAHNRDKFEYQKQQDARQRCKEVVKEAKEEMNEACKDAGMSGNCAEMATICTDAISDEENDFSNSECLPLKFNAAKNLKDSLPDFKSDRDDARKEAAAMEEKISHIQENLLNSDNTALESIAQMEEQIEGISLSMDEMTLTASQTVKDLTSKFRNELEKIDEEQRNTELTLKRAANQLRVNLKRADAKCFKRAQQEFQARNQGKGKVFAKSLGGLSARGRILARELRRLKKNCKAEPDNNIDKEEAQLEYQTVLNATVERRALLQQRIENLKNAFNNDIERTRDQRVSALKRAATKITNLQKQILLLKQSQDAQKQQFAQQMGIARQRAMNASYESQRSDMLYKDASRKLSALGPRALASAGESSGNSGSFAAALSAANKFKHIYEQESACTKEAEKGTIYNFKTNSNQ